MSVRTNDPRPPEIFEPALCTVGVGCGKPYESICGKCNLAWCSDHLKAEHACGNWPATRLATPEPDPAKSDTPEYVVGQQLTSGLVVVHEETLKKLQGPFTCGHPAEFAGGACAACHALTLEKLEAVILQIREMTDAMNKIHDLAGQVTGSNFVNSHMGAIQDWCHKVTGPCAEKPKCLHGGVFRGEKCGACGEEVR